jgi:uridine phosphorylase
MIRNPGPFSASDLPISPEGKAYHLDIKPENLAKDIIIVGDPGRAAAMGKEYLKKGYFNREHRGLRTVTGYTKDTNQRVSFVTSGMGTPSLEIVLQEIVALNEIDIETKMRKDSWDHINIIRVGTTGGLIGETALGMPLITEYAVGMDNTGLFYDIPPPDDNCRNLKKLVGPTIDDLIPNESEYKGTIKPYVSMATPAVVDALERSADVYDVDYKKGITVSSSGFFANQGRHIARIAPTVKDIDEAFTNLDPEIEGLRFENMEMEASFLLHFMGGLGYSTGCICPAIANRREDTFDHAYEQNIMSAGKVALGALYDLRQQQTD